MDIARTSPKLIAQARLTDAIRHSPTMAIQREQVGVMRGASVPRRGRPEADVSSAGALASVPPRVSALPFDRASRTFPTALPAAWQSVAQLVNLPPDSFGKLEDIKLDIGEGEITGKDLQIALITSLSKVIGVKPGFGYRVASLDLYAPDTMGPEYNTPRRGPRDAGVA